MTDEELRMLEGEAVNISVEPEIVQREWNALKDTRRKVEKASRGLYLKLLERGVEGASVEQLAHDMEPSGVSTPSLEGALEKLEKNGLISEAEPGKYSATSTLKVTGETHEVRVDKVYRGFAAVTVDNRWEAMLTPEEYEGPRSLIKRGSRFRASGLIYREGGRLYLRVTSIIEILDKKKSDYKLLE
jgi:Fanconi anemia group M protein